MGEYPRCHVLLVPYKYDIIKYDIIKYSFMWTGEGVNGQDLSIGELSPKYFVSILFLHWPPLGPFCLVRSGEFEIAQV